MLPRSHRPPDSYSSSSSVVAQTAPVSGTHRAAAAVAVVAAVGGGGSSDSSGVGGAAHPGELLDEDVGVQLHVLALSHLSQPGDQLVVCIYRRAAQLLHAPQGLDCNTRDIQAWL